MRHIGNFTFTEEDKSSMLLQMYQAMQKVVNEDGTFEGSFNIDIRYDETRKSEENWDY